jgi:PAS domain-containing protein
MKRLCALCAYVFQKNAVILRGPQKIKKMLIRNSKMEKIAKIAPSNDRTIEVNLHNVLMRSPFAFAVLKGKNSIVTLANESIKRVWGKGSDVEGKSLFDVIPEIKTQGFPELIDSVYTTGVPFVGEEMLVKLLRGGKLIDTYFNFTYEPYREIDGAISGVTIIAYEVTTQTVLNQKVKESEIYLEKAVQTRTKELLEANEELRLRNQEIADSKLKLMSEYSRSLIEASLDPLIVINPKGRITDMNQAAIDVIGESRQTLRGTLPIISQSLNTLKKPIKTYFLRVL